jgi:hypothetical protein
MKQELTDPAPEVQAPEVGGEDIKADPVPGPEAGLEVEDPIVESEPAETGSSTSHPDDTIEECLDDKPKKIPHKIDPAPDESFFVEQPFKLVNDLYRLVFVVIIYGCLLTSFVYTFSEATFYNRFKAMTFFLCALVFICVEWC